ncbi:isoleucine--tRNA ligase [Mycoplasma crocodyli]|uniref:Isoleucine--tRNA ligase n=1 Tax=Mycoplasma crocodyli (strain ATCC 51981 / MP145) TaxID=512564 RepID=D5E509_MYCCM|nr:isoleucine--tRNA ligase [Mycoplasma crocodyli]ADE19863.1 isoleucine--tRNA ligase [Mycoplasma crocodyli MP145]
MDYKKTLNMPNTKFDMRANLTQKEPLFRKQWEDNLIYKKVLDKNRNNQSFILHDGPPYANGDLHVGHALNKILKDIIVRYKSLRGFYSPYVPGWDTHGLPIEHKMLEEAKLNKDELTPLILRKKAAKYAFKQIDNQRKQFKTLQMLSNFEDIYITMNKSFEAKQLKLFKKMVLDGLVFKGLKPVYWSPSSQSALAEAEVEYQDVISPSIFVAFEIKKAATKTISKGDYIVIWTTTPWTLIANAGAALGSEFYYSKIEYNNKKYFVATDLVEKFISQMGWENYKIIGSYHSKELVGSTYLTPILKHEAPVVFGHHVTLESGTGIVHIAPLFGEDDFLIGKKNNLEMIMHISDNGHIDYECKYDKLYYEKANKIIIEDLINESSLIKEDKIKHSYPHDWRTHKPIMFRGTPQWFVSIDKIKDKILSELEKIETYPLWAKKRMMQMIQNRNDWTISRQRTWGVPIIIFYDESKKPIIEEEIFDYVINLVELYGCDIWWEKETDELLPEKFRNKNFTREMDIMDVWFDSGSTSIAVDIEGVKQPYDVYLEGIDQYRGWFNSSIINSVAYSGKSPYKTLISHGFVLDGKGEKMSKSKGNIISPLDVVKKNGADILRLWAANSEYSNDVNISESILDQNGEIYRKIRNTLRFLLGNLEGYKYNKNQKRDGIHSFIKEELNNLKVQILNAYDEYKFINVIKILNNYIVNLSSFYLSVTKDILYVDKYDSDRRMQTLANFYEITEFLIFALGPILPTTIEETYSFFNKENKVESFMLENYDFSKLSVNNKVLDEFAEFFELRDRVNILIENAIKNGLIKRSNEAFVMIKKPSSHIEKLDLKQLLMVGKISYNDNERIEYFDGEKCQRCWNHFEKSDIKNDLCIDCFEIIKDVMNEK